MKELIRALRCSSSTHCDCDHRCKYYYVPTEDEIQAFLEATGQRQSDFLEEFWGGCDGDRIYRDAADALERMEGAVPVVRCKECLNYSKFKHADGGICMVGILAGADPDGFCSRGRRKEDGK